MALVVLFAVATLIRLFGINEVPLDFHPTKQFRSALTSRAYYYDLLDSIPAWKQEVARVNLQRLGVLHPPVLDRAVALAYALAGDEHLWIPRLGLSLSWVIGGVFLYLTVCKLVSADAAVASTAFYLLLPFGVQASQSYQIDPLMVMMMVISLFAVVRYHEQPSLRRLVIASTCSATAILLKPVCAFIVRYNQKLWIGESE